MEISYFDLIVASIILLLGLKGIINGFFKEVFGLVGIIGGIFLASRVGDGVGEYLNNAIFHFSSSAAVNFLGFLTTLAAFWILMVLIGYIFKKLSSVSGLGPLDKLFGFVFGAGKFFLIAAVIAHAAYNIKAVHSSIDSTLETSVLFPILVETGSFIMKIDPVEMSEEIQDINNSLKKGSDAIKEKAEALVEESAKEQVQKMKEQIQETQKQEEEK